MRNKILQYIVGSVFIISGLFKALNVLSFQYHIIQYGFPKLNILAPFITLTEILIGCFFLLSIKVKKTSVFSTLLLLLFSIIYLYGYIYNDIKDCGCFGDYLKIHSPTFVFIRNGILIVICIYLSISNTNNDEKYQKWKNQLLLTIMFPSVFISATTFRYIPIDKKKHVLQDKKISETYLKELSIDINKRSLICFFSYDCPHCWNSISQLDSYVSNKQVDTIQVYLVNKDDNSDYKKLFLEYFSNLKYTEIKHEVIDKEIKVFPTNIFIRNDSIKYVYQGTLPSAYIWDTFILNNQ